jgi:multicomponent Na+:H+ antiporter subunit F
MTWTGPVGVSATLALALLAGGMVLCFVRLVRGPDVLDRLVALDLVSTLAVGAAAVYALATGDALLLRVGAALALVSFLGTVAFASYVERSEET